jgi:DNA-binding MarR family transcriptional regulator
MVPSSPPALNGVLHTLAEFRYSMLQFMQFSENVAASAGLQARQYQLLLQVAGAPPDTLVTVAYAAERLGLKHNSAVELVDRSEREGLLSREEDQADRRRTILRVTRKGRLLLAQLASEHARELTELAPRLIHTLEHLRQQAVADRAVLEKQLTEKP